MSQIGAEDKNVDIDLGRLFLAIKENALKIIIAMIAVGILAFFLVNMLDERYSSQARILIDNREPTYSDQQLGAGSRDADVLDERGITSQVEIVRSSDLVMEVARKLDLASFEEFDTPKKPSGIKSILIGLGLISNPFELPAEERILKTFYERLDVFQVASSRVIVIEFWSNDPKLAAEVPNAMADAFLRSQAGEKLKDNSDASAWLEPEIARLRNSVREAEARVAEYRADKGLLMVGQTDTLNSRQLSDISTELTRVRSERVDAEARALTVRRVLENGQDVESIANVLDSRTIQRLRENEATIRAEIADLSTTLLDGHPRMQALRSQLIDVQRQLRGEARKVLASLENEASVARLRERELTSNLNTIKADSAQAGGEEVQLRALEREAASQRQLLETYLSRFRESASRSQASAVPPNARIISSAIEATEAYFPKKLPIIIVAVVVTAIFGAIWVMLAELFSGRAIRSAVPASAPSQAQTRIEPSVSAAAPLAPQAPMVAKTQKPKINLAQKAPLAASLISEDIPPADVGDETGPFAYTVNEIVNEFKQAGTPLVICLSPEGDTAVAGSIMIARNLANSGSHTVLVDLTINGGPSSVMVGTDQTSGLTNLLCGEASIADTIHGDTASIAHVMARGNGDIERAMRGADRIPMILKALAESYDTVVVECGPSAVQSVLKLVKNTNPQFVVSVNQLPLEELDKLQDSFAERGHYNIIALDLIPADPMPVQGANHGRASSSVA